MARWANLRRCVRRNLVEVEPSGVKSWCQSRPKLKQTGLVELDKIYSAHLSTPPTISERMRAVEESEVIQHILQPLSFSVWRFKVRSTPFLLHITSHRGHEERERESWRKWGRVTKWDAYLYLTSCSESCPGLLIMVQNHPQK